MLAVLSILTAVSATAFVASKGQSSPAATITVAPTAQITAPPAPPLPAPPLPAPCNGHPRNIAGFVTDGGPQCPGPVGPPGFRYQWCVGPQPGRFACMVAIDPGLPALLNAAWNAAHPVVVEAAGVAASVNTGSIEGPWNGTERCIFTHENGGDYGRSLNPGHFGAFQFAPGTWVAYGGSSGSWGNASPGEQWRVFHNAARADPSYSNWLPYEHGVCWLGMR